MKEGHGTMMSRSHFWNFEFSITAWFFGEEVTMYEWEGKMLSKQLISTAYQDKHHLIKHDGTGLMNWVLFMWGYIWALVRTRIFF